MSVHHKPTHNIYNICRTNGLHHPHKDAQETCPYFQPRPTPPLNADKTHIEYIYPPTEEELEEDPELAELFADFDFNEVNHPYYLPDETPVELFMHFQHLCRFYHHVLFQEHYGLCTIDLSRETELQPKDIFQPHPHRRFISFLDQPPAELRQEAQEAAAIRNGTNGKKPTYTPPTPSP